MKIMKKEIQYEFRYNSKCNMCGEPFDNHKVLGKRLNQSQGKNPRKRSGISVSVLRCKKCGLIYSNPTPIPATIAQHYDVDPDLYWPDIEDLFKEDHYKYEIETFKKLSNQSIHGLKALDIGSGLGQSIVALKNAGFEVKALEPSRAFYNKAIELTGLGEEAIQLTSLEDAVLPKDYFDFVSFPNVLEHLQNPNDAILKALETLKPGGLMFVCIPSAYWLQSKIVNAYFKLIGTDYVTNLSPMHPPFHLYEFSPKSFYINAEINHYEIALLKIHPHSITSARILSYFFKKLTEITNTGLRMDVWIRKPH